MSMNCYFLNLDDTVVCETYDTFNALKADLQTTYSGVKAITLRGSATDTDCSGLFSSCQNLKTVNLGNLDYDTVLNITITDEMFKNCAALESIYIDNQLFSGVTSSTNMFLGCTSLVGAIAYNPEKIDITYANTSIGYFKDTGLYCSYYINGNSYSGDYGTLADIKKTVIDYNKDTITSISVNGTSDDINCSHLFEGLTLATTISATFVFNSTATDFSYMFANCPKVTSITLLVDTFSSAENLEGLFYNDVVLSSITSSTISKISTAKNISKIYEGCAALTSVNLPDFSTVINAEKACYGCTQLETGSIMFSGTLKNIKHMYANCTSLTEVTISGVVDESLIPSEDPILLDTAEGVFLNCANLTEICNMMYYISEVKIKVKSKSYKDFFGGCSALTSLDISETLSIEITEDASNMFYNCFNLKNIYCLEDWSLYQNQCLSTDMFYGCTSLIGAIAYDPTKTNISMANKDTGYFSEGSLIVEYSLGIDTIETPSIYRRMNTYAELNSGFIKSTLIWYITHIKLSGKAQDNSCANLFSGYFSTSIDLSELDTSNVTDMSFMFMFSAFGENTYINLSNLDTSNVVNMMGMFASSGAKNIIGLESLDTSNVVTMEGMFSLSSFTTIDLTGLNVKNVAVFTQMFQMLSTNPPLTKIYAIGDWKKIAPSTTMSTQMFDGCLNLVGAIEYDSDKTDLNYANSTTGYFSTCLNVSYTTTLNETIQHKLYTSYTDLKNNLIQNPEYKTILKTIAIKGYDEEADISSLFEGCSSLVSINMDGWDTSNIKNMSKIFKDCVSLSALDLTPIDTSKVEDMSSMFEGCVSLINLDLSKTKTSSAVNMSKMFKDCSSLANINIQNFETDGVLNMKSMFENCRSVTSLKIKNWDTSRVETFEKMFSDCYLLSDLDTSKMSAASASSLFRMFYKCYALKILNLYNFNLISPINFTEMFYNCQRLEEIYCSEDWKFGTGIVSTNMFKNCISLIGKIPYSDDNTNNVLQANPSSGYFKNYLLKKFVVNGVERDIRDPSILKEDMLVKATSQKNGIVKPNNTTIIFNNSNKLKKNYTYTLPNATKTVTGGIRVLYEPRDNHLYISSDGKFPAPLRLDYKSSGSYGIGNGTTYFCNIKDVNSFIHGATYRCHSFTYLKLSGKSLTGGETTIPNSYYPWGVFESCSNASIIDVSDFDASNLTGISRFFAYCNNCSELNLSKWNCTPQGDLDYTFFQVGVSRNGSSETIFDGSGIHTQNITSMYHTFAGADFQELDLSMWDTSSLTNMSSTFYNMDNIKTINLNGWNTSNVTDMSYAFAANYYLTNIIGLEYFNTSKLTTLYNTFFGAGSSYYNPIENPVIKNLSNWDVSNVTDMSETFAACEAFQLTGLTSWNTNNVLTMYGTFGYYPYNIDVSGWQNSKVTTMAHMFEGVGEKGTLNLTNFKTPSVTTMESMFTECVHSSLNLSSFNTQNLTRIDYMCSGMHNITSITLPFYTPNMFSMEGVFSRCDNLVSVNLSSFDTTNVVRMPGLFNQCTNLLSPGISSFRTPVCEQFYKMFYECKSLFSINVNHLDVSKAEYGKDTESAPDGLQKMFANCSNLRTIYCNNDWEDMVIRRINGHYMFIDCVNLVGDIPYDDENPVWPYDVRDDKVGIYRAKPVNGYFTKL